MNKFIRYIGGFLICIFISLQNVLAQCAMCRATVENNISEGGNIGSGLNAGILYLAAMPYLIFIVIVYLWYKNSRKNLENKKQMAGYPRR